MGVSIRTGAVTDPGRVRQNNEDAFGTFADRGLWIMADGMGGHQGGEVASRLAVDVLSAAYREPTAEALASAVNLANERILEAGDADPDLRGMGTTVVVAALVPGDGTDVDHGTGDDDDGVEPPERLLIANVGDSRAYLYRDDELIQVTDDHSMVADLVRQGRLTREEAEQHPQRNVVTRALGVHPGVEVDIFPVDPLRGDRYVLCSDGLFDEVHDDQIAAVLRRLADPQEAAVELVRLANERGGRDNITVVLLDVVDDGGVAEAASAALGREPAPRRPAAASDDPAGFTAALDKEALRRGLQDDLPDDDDDRRRSRRRRDRDDASPRTRLLTWRVALFVVLVLAVIAGAFATIWWYGTNAYYVAFDDDEVAIFKGRPGGVLWIDPQLEERTGIDRPDVPRQFLHDLEDGRQYADLGDARRYVANIEGRIEDVERERARATSTTTEAPATSTTATG